MPTRSSATCRSPCSTTWTPPAATPARRFSTPRGELIGLNFDRVYEATINDFAWDESYSRSIGVDVRFILWSLAKFSGAERLLAEMGINN